LLRLFLEKSWELVFPHFSSAGCLSLEPCQSSAWWILLTLPPFWRVDGEGEPRNWQAGTKEEAWNFSLGEAKDFKNVKH